jgi:hypothetical protein
VIEAAMANRIEVKINSGNDDAHEVVGRGAVNLTSSDMELGVNGARVSGLRFAGIDIPAGATITKAYIQFQAEGSSRGAASFVIHGQDTDNALQFAKTSRNISSRTTTDASVNWNPPDWTAAGAAGTAQQTSDLSAIIQEIIDRPGWQADNALAFIVSGSGARFAESFNGSSAGAPRLIIEYTELPTVSVAAGGDAGEPDSDGAFTITLSKTSATDTVVSYTVGGSATSGADYQALPGTVTIPAGQLAATIQVNAIDDLAIEGNESVTLRLDSIVAGDSAIAVDSSPASIAIIENDVPLTVSVESSRATALERFSATGSTDGAEPDLDGLFVVRLNKVSATDTVVGYTVSGTATAGADYQALSGTVTILAGQLSADIPVRVLDDFFVEGNESVVIRLTSVLAGDATTVLDTTAANVAIADNDQPPPVHTIEARIASSRDDAHEIAGRGTINLTSGDLELGVNGARIAGLRFNDLDIPAGAKITNAYIQFQADSTSRGAASFVIRGQDADNPLQFSTAARNISSRPTTDASVTWTPPDWSRGAAGQDQRTPDLSAIIQEIVDRPGWQQDNSLAFIISGTGARFAESYNGGASRAPRLVIEYSEVPTVSIAASGNAGEPDVDGLFVVSLDRASATATTIAYTVSGSAASGSDYQALSGTVTIAAGQLTATLRVDTIDDFRVEGNETVTVRLDGIVAGDPNIAVDQGPASIVIVENDTPNIATVAAAGDAGEPDVNGSFTVRLSAASPTDTVLSYTVSGSATSGADYQALSGTVTIAAGQLSATIDVNAIDDFDIEGDESVTVRLDSVVAGAENVTVNSTPATVAIVEDDFPLTVSVLSAQSFVLEHPTASVGGEGDAAEPDLNGLFVVRLNKTSATDTVIGYVISGTATAGADYRTLSGTITIPAGELNADIPVEVLDDLLLEGDESVVVRLTAVIAGDATTVLDPTPANVTIADDDVPNHLSIAAAANAAEPGTNGRFVVSLDHISASDTVLAYSVSGTAANGSDYQTLSGTVTIAAGQTSATIHVNTIDDLLSEGNENVTIRIDGVLAGDANITLAQTTATVSLLDNDAPPNIAPVAEDDAVSLTRGGSIAISVLDNDEDADGDALTVANIARAPANGSVQVNTNGTITYTPNGSFVGRDSFEYRVADGNGGFDLAEVVINVTDQSPATSYVASTASSGFHLQHTNASKSFYHDGTWWAVLPSGSSWHVMEAPAQQGAAWSVASNPMLGSSYTADVAWDAATGSLYVLQTASSSNVYLFKLNYSLPAGTWTQTDSIKLAGSGAVYDQGYWGNIGDMALGLDQNGNVMVASVTSSSVGAQGLHLLYADADNLHAWNQVTVDTGTTTAGGSNGDSKPDFISFSHDGVEQIGIVYGRDGSPNSWSIAWHDTAANVANYSSAWSREAITSSVAIDDHIAAVSDGETIYAVIKDNQDVLWLLRGQPGNWDAPVRVHSNGSEGTSRPGIVYDESNNELYIFYQHDAGGSYRTYMKRTDADNPQFNPSADGIAVIASVTNDNPQGPSHAVGADTGGTFYLFGEAGTSFWYNDILLGSDDLIA